MEDNAELTARDRRYLQRRHQPQERDPRSREPPVDLVGRSSPSLTTGRQQAGTKIPLRELELGVSWRLAVDQLITPAAPVTFNHTVRSLTPWAYSAARAAVIDSPQSQWPARSVDIIRPASPMPQWAVNIVSAPRSRRPGQTRSICLLSLSSKVNECRDCLTATSVFNTLPALTT